MKLFFLINAPKDNNKLKAPETKQSQFVGKCNTPNEFLYRDFKWQNSFFVFYKKDHIEEEGWKLQHKEHDNKSKVVDHKGPWDLYTSFK